MVTRLIAYKIKTEEDRGNFGAQIYALDHETQIVIPDYVDLFRSDKNLEELTKIFMGVPTKDDCEFHIFTVSSASTGFGGQFHEIKKFLNKEYQQP